MVTTFYLIRHGETQGAEVLRYKGSIDVPLSENGIKQMGRVAEYLNRNTGLSTLAFPSRGEAKVEGESHFNKLNAVYCSDLSRAIKSAEIIAGPHSLRPIITPSLRERNFGIWEGMSFDEIRERYPEEFGAWAGNPLEFSPMGGESTLEVQERVVIALDDILSNHSPERGEGKGGGESIAVVSHGGVNRIILCRILGIPLENIFRIEQDYAAFNIIEFRDKYPVVKLINGKAG